MKLFKLALCLARIGTNVPTNDVLPETSAPQKSVAQNITQEMNIDAKVEILNLNTEFKDLRKFGNKRTLKPAGEIQLNLSEEQSNFWLDMNFKDFKVVMKHRVEYVASWSRGFMEFEETFDQSMHRLDMKITREVGQKKMEVNRTLGRVLHRDKKGKSSVFIKPSIDIDINDFNNEVLGDEIFHFNWAIRQVSLIGKKQVYDLNQIRKRVYNVKYKNVYKENTIENLIRQDELITWITNSYILPEDFIDKEATFKNFKYEPLNHSKINKLFIEIHPNKRYEYVGQLIQEVSLQKDRQAIDDLENVPAIRTSKLHELFDELFIDLNTLKIELNIEDKTARFYNEGKDIKRTFINDGPLNNLSIYKDLKIINNEETIVDINDGNVHINPLFIEDNFNGLLDNYFAKKNEIEKPKPEINNDGKETINWDSNEADDEEIEEEKPSIKTKKSSPLKYLWLLTIPVSLGIITLLVWFNPFRKRKSK